VQDSGELSRRLPTPRYFELIRALATIFDDLVGANCGVVGKHAGDGMTAFFLADGDPSRAAAGALRTVRGLQRWAAELGAQLDGAGAPALRVNCALHWGANLYMGQVVPGGRLDVSALGDEVNECARMQESTRDGAVSMSKEFAELLPPDAPASLGVDAARLLYQPLSALPGATQKAIRDAGTLAVAQI
jgi:class 3 adenylate cyclase